jgi:UDP-N-acetylglucosamine 1-carboxyvinyltransferase
MKKYIIKGGKKLSGSITVSGAKNVVLPAIIAACLSGETVEIKNVPLIADFYVMLELVKEIGGTVTLSGHTVKIKVEKIHNVKIPLETGAKIRTSSMFVAPLLARCGEALIPNPGGCRIGARPIDRHIEGLMKMGASCVYNSEDGYFHLKTNKLRGATYKFSKNSHTGTEVLIMAAVLAEGETIIENAAQEPEVDDLIKLLALMGAKIKRIRQRTILIEGVKKLKGASYSIMPDRNEVVTFAVLSALTGGNITIKNIQTGDIEGFLKEFKKAGGDYKATSSGIRFYMKNGIKPTDVVTAPHPGFMTDWQGPWAIFMTQAKGKSTIHETVYENRFGYAPELKKMGVDLSYFKPEVENAKDFYNFNYADDDGIERQALKIVGPTKLHNAVLDISDLRAGATLVIGSLIAHGESVIYGVEFLERGYEAFDKRLKSLGADIKTEGEEMQL